MDKKQLEARLIQWAEEYGGGRYEHIGYSSRNMLQSLIEHQGLCRVPVATAAFSSTRLGTKSNPQCLPWRRMATSDQVGRCDASTS